ncbi:MAG: 30S ribosomal protein S12 methylthiotransferase RimO [Lachnospiraceae bacterium]|nr:30S ribosomal protein S12 methylthiotransferase RimO [Lachnospiraceae bacterium]
MKSSSENGIPKSPESTFRVFFISLGCDKNLVDSEQMTGLLVKRGYRMVTEAKDADIIVVNTCCFIGDAKEESINTIIEMGQTGRKLIVCGCLAQRYAEEIKKEMPEVDAIVGTTSIDAIADAADEVMATAQTENRSKEPFVHTASIDRYVYLTGSRELSAPVSASLKIADGCNKNCSYCVIPQVRGHYRSVPMDDIISDAKDLAERGIKELILIAQETTVYGTDLYGKKALPELLHRLCAIEGPEWIRLMYCYPEEITDELIECIASEPKICHYLDMPIQHCSDRILRLMGRKTDKKSLVNITKKLRRRIPDIALRTTLISGFPKETEEEHRELLDFVRGMRFDRLGDFTYSAEEGTKAAGMKGQIHHSTKKRRQREIMEAQQQVAFENEAALNGRRIRVMIEGVIDGGVYVARSYRDAPDIDGYVYIENAKGAGYMSGDMTDVMITGSRGYDLLADMI